MKQVYVLFVPYGLNIMDVLNYFFIFLINGCVVKILLYGHLICDLSKTLCDFMRSIFFVKSETDSIAYIENTHIFQLFVYSRSLKPHTADKSNSPSCLH